MNVKQRRSSLGTVLSYFYLIFLTLICVIPFYLMLVNGTRASVAINQGVSFIPGTYLFQNFMNLITKVNLFQGFINTVIISVGTTALSLYVSALTAWGFSIYEFKFKKILWALVLVVIMIPNTLGIIGYYELMLNLHLIDNFLALILPAGATSVTVFFLHQYIKGGIPRDFYEAAQIDGAKELYTFHKIALPLMIPALATMGIFAFVGSWNNFLAPLIILYSPDHLTLPLLISQLNSTAYKTDFGVVYLGIGLTVLPLLLIFALFSRYILNGLTMGGVKE